MLVQLGDGGSNPNGLEREICSSLPEYGYPEDIIIPLAAFRLLDGTALGTTAGAPPFLANLGGTNMTNMQVIRWRQDAGTTNGIATTIVLPGQFNPVTDRIQVIPTVRKANAAGAEENATLNLRLNAVWGRPGLIRGSATAATSAEAAGATVTALASQASLRLAAAVDTNSFGFSAYQFNLSSGPAATAARDQATAAQRLFPLDTLTLALSPSATVGTTTMTVDLLGVLVRITRSVSLFDRDSRFAFANIRGTSRAITPA